MMVNFPAVEQVTTVQWLPRYIVRGHSDDSPTCLNTLNKISLRKSKRCSAQGHDPRVAGGHIQKIALLQHPTSRIVR